MLAVGLGNRGMTADAVGPLVLENLLVTRHMETFPFSTAVAALAPGVLAATGMETAELVRGTVQQVRPAVILVIDALAARSAQRLCAAVQLSDTGLIPGSGVGNHRRAIDGEANGNASVLEQRRRSVSDEHKKIFDDYFKSAVKITTKLEGLTGWSDELRGQFWGEILTESPSNSKPAEEAIAGMENIIKTHLKLTVGG